MNEHIGSDFDDFLIEEGIFQDVEAAAIRFAKWLGDNTIIVKDNHRQILYHYTDEKGVSANYTLDGIYKEWQRNH